MPSKSENQARFLKVFKDKGTIVSTSEETGIKRGTHYQWMRDDADYKEAFIAAKDDFAETIEMVLFDRVRYDKKCAPVLIIFALKGLLRDKYGDKPMEVAGEDEDILSKLSRIESRLPKKAQALAKELIVTKDDPLGTEDND